jgi:hypothetical protein
MRARIIPEVVEGLPAVFVCWNCSEAWTGLVDPEDGAPVAKDTCPLCGLAGQPQSDCCCWEDHEEEE